MTHTQTHTEWCATHDAHAHMTHTDTAAEYAGLQAAGACLTRLGAQGDGERSLEWLCVCRATASALAGREGSALATAASL